CKSSARPVLQRPGADQRSGRHAAAQGGEGRSMLTVSDLKVDIQGSRIPDGIDLTVNPGELVCLMGRNGAGKTTTFRTIMGYRRPVSGRIMFDGTDITGLATWRIAQKGVGFSPEESEVYADLTVAENIELATWTRPQGRPAQERLEYAYR